MQQRYSMQSIRHGIRNTSLFQAQARNLQPHQIASSSRVQWDSRRHAWKPMEWFRKTMSPQYREKDSEQQVEAARKQLKETGQSSVFDAMEEVTAHEGKDVTRPGDLSTATTLKKYTNHKYSTAMMSISHRKLNLLSRQVAGKPIDSAILQMQFSEKRVSNKLKNMLILARNTAVLKGLDREKLVVAESWVNKGPGGRAMKRIEIKGRGKIGIRKKYKAKMHVLLEEGLTFEERLKKERDYKLSRIVSAGLVREDVPLRNPSAAWAW